MSARGRQAIGPAPEIDAAAIDWAATTAMLEAEGAAIVPLLDAAACAALVALYADAARFRSRVVMERHGYGSGEYQYLAYPLPPVIAGLRAALYPPLAAIANRWQAALGEPARFPPDHAAYLRQCHTQGQTRPTPLLLRYGAGDYNCLHQDLYGAEVFPLQVAILLSAPGRDFTGGEFVLTEQRPRRQSRATVVPLRQGEGVIFPVRHRPIASSRGTAGRGAFRAGMRHGVSLLRGGERYTLGIIFHDAA